MEAAARTGAVAAERVEATLREHPTTHPTRGPPCLTSTGSSPPSSRRSPRTAPTSTQTRWPRSSTASSTPASAASCPGGSTGEFTTLTNAERREVIEVTVEAAAGRVPVVAGTGALSTRETVELSLHAERAGAAAVMVVPPFYEALGWRELLAHYTAVADAISIPIMYYNLPSASGVTLTAEQLRELADRARTCKDTGGDASRRHRADPDRDGPTLLNGWDTLTFAALAAGVRAVVWGTASILPEQCVALHRLLIDEIDLPAARELWTRLWPLCHFLESQSYSAAVKTACALVGDTTGPVRAPLLPLDDDAHRRAGRPARAREGEPGGRLGRADHGRPARGTSTVVVSSTASRAAFRGLLVEVGRGAGDERAPVLAAEPAREDAEAVGHRDLLDDLAAGGDAAEHAAERVGGPDVLLGVERAAVGREGDGAEHRLRCRRARAWAGPGPRRGGRSARRRAGS